MISKRDNLLIRPWQDRKFEHHRRKVQSALPAIDTNSPVYRSHVAVKLKKQQNENERCKKIERDNYLLLKKMDYIMKTSRVDNSWRNPQPTFLNRIAMYNPVVPKIEDIEFDQVDSEDEKPKSRKSRCYACTPQKNAEKRIPEERVLWEIPKKPAGRTRSKSVPVRKSDTSPIFKDGLQISSDKLGPVKKLTTRPNTTILKDLKTYNIKGELSAKEPQNIILTRGCLKLSVNFPSDTLVKLQNGHSEKILVKSYCHCKNSPYYKVF